MTTNEPAGASRYPSSANIRKELKTLCGRLREPDSALVTFSGFELQFAGSDEYYLCPADANKADKRTLVTLTEVCDELARSKAKSKVVVIDACRGREGLAEGRASRPKMPPAGVAVLFACSPGELAFEVPTGLKSGALPECH